MHRTYDPNLTHDDDRDIIVQLESKHNLQRRVSEIGLRKHSLGRRAFSYDGAMEAQQRKRESSTTSGEDSVFFANETGGSRRGYIRQLSQGNRRAERAKQLSPKMRRHSSHQSSYRSSGSSAGFGHDNLAYIKEDDESATSEDIFDKDDMIKTDIKNSTITDIIDEEMTFTELEPKQANGVVPSDTSVVEHESELRQLDDQNEASKADNEELDTKL